LCRASVATTPDVLEGAGDALAGYLVAFDAAQRRPVEDHRARARPVHPRDRIEARGFSRAVGPDQAEDLPATDVEGDRVQRHQTAKLHRQILCLQKDFTLGNVNLPMDTCQFFDRHVAGSLSPGGVRSRSRAAFP
jgi:hypothetical protein